jgi:hypothetical protein
MRVKVGALYTFQANLFDAAVRPTGIPDGTVIKVINLPSAPKANTMGMCYAANPETGKFLAMVCTASLTPVRKMTVAEELAQLRGQLALSEAK